MSAREDILGRVRAALRPAGLSTDIPSVPPAPRQPPSAHRIDLFMERVADYRADVRTAIADDLVRLLVEVVPADSQVVLPPGLPSAITGAVNLAARNAMVDDGRPAPELDAFDTVITTARVGIAETGTIVLDHEAGQGRRALTLVPDRHVCVVRQDQIVDDVPDAIALLDPRRPQTWVSGPSATSDIELDRVEGVHGPRHLIVVVLGV